MTTNDTSSHETNPRSIARIAGLFYLLTGGTAFAFFTRGKLFTGADAANIVSNILVHESLYRSAVVADLFGTACYLVVVTLLYRLFKPVNASVSLLAAFCGLLGCAVQAGACCFDLAALTTARALSNPASVSSDQLYAAVQLLIRLHAQSFNLAILFFGFYCFFIGCLALRATFLPRVVGALMAVAGFAYIVNEVASFLSLPLAGYLSSYATILGGVGELSLLLWLLIFGVNAQRWREQAHRDI
ncbi:MAG: DUF4386 domain-containing protein [Candidatus Udaeobacter sp.]